MTISGSGNKVWGAILMANTQGGSTSLRLAGGAEVYYSSEALCRVEQAGLLGGGALAVVSGSWMQL